MNFLVVSTLVLSVFSKSKCKNSYKSQDKPTAVLDTIPVPRTDYTAHNTINAAYRLPATTDHVAVAGMTIDTTRPTVNLANFPHIIGVACLPNEIQVKFDDDSHIKEAFNEWSNTANLAIFLSHETQCHGTNSVTTYHVSKLSIQGLILNIDFQPLDIGTVMQNFTLEVIQSKNNTGTLSKRNFWDTIAAPFKKIGDGIKNALTWSKDAGFSKEYDLNYNPATQTAVQQRIQLLSNQFAEVDCVNCFGMGSAGIHATVKGIFLKIESYELDLFGEIKTNLDMDMTIKSGHFEYRRNLFGYQFTAVGVPGLFSFGPEVQLDAAVSYDVTEDIEFSFGFDYDLPMQFTISSNDGIFGKPTITSVAKSTFHDHPFKMSKDIQVKIAAHLIPIIDLSLKVLTLNAVQLGVEFDNQLGFEFDTGAFRFCPTNGLNVALFEQTDINLYAKELSSKQTFNVFTFHTNLWTNCAQPKVPTIPPSTTTDSGKVKTVPTIPATTTVQTTTTTVAATTTAQATTIQAATTAQATTIQAATTAQATTIQAATTTAQATTTQAATTTTAYNKPVITTTPVPTTTNAYQKPIITTDVPKITTTIVPTTTTTVPVTTTAAHHVSLPRNSYVPSNSIKTAFKLPTKSNQAALAWMDIATLQPTVNLANFAHITGIACLNSAIEITFDDRNHTHGAFHSWSTTPNLAMMINHEIKCHGVDGVTAYQVSSLAIQNLKLLVSFQPLEMPKLLQNYTLDVVQLKDSQPLSKRGFWDTFKWTKDGGVSKSFGINYSADTQGAVQGLIPIVSDGKFSINCLNCFAEGTIGIHATVKGLFLAIESYEIDFIGELKANMDIDLKVEGGKFGYRKKLFDLQLLSIGVPALFTFSPGIELDTATNFDMAEDIEVTVGFDYSLPLELSIASTNGIFGIPTITTVAKSIVNSHPLALSKDIGMKMDMHLIPMINLDLKVLFLDGFQLSLEFDNQMALDVTLNASGNCTTEAALYEQNDVNFYYRSPSSVHKYSLFTHNSNLWMKCKAVPSAPTTKPTATQESLEHLSTDDTHSTIYSSIISTTLPISVTTSLPALSFSSVMNTVPVVTGNYSARIQIEAAFEISNEIGISSIAGMILNTTRPTVNIANFDHISGIACLDNTIRLAFDSDSHLNLAYNEWSSKLGFAVLIPHEIQCHGNSKIGAYIVTNVQLVGGGLDLYFETTLVEHIVDSFSLEIIQNKDSNISKRDAWVRNNTLAKAFGFNYNEDTRQPVISPIQFALSNSNKFYCTDCFAFGNSGIHSYFTGNSTTIHSYELDLFGNFNVSMGVNLFVDLNGKIEFKNVMYDIQFLSVGVPGLFSIGPEIQLEAVLFSYSDHIKLHLMFGFDYYLNFDFKISSQNGLFAAPNITTVAPGNFNAHNFFYDGNHKIRVAAHMVPIIDIGVHMFGSDPVQLGIKFDNEIGFEFDTGKFDTCASDQVEFRLYEEHSLNFYAKQYFLSEESTLWSYDKTFWSDCILNSTASGNSSGTININIPFINK
ncbi:hypothetical protein HDV06_005665 [Boothiomyces sp. JEL0866]|nr:hypothetical protein HDV06_005665 [Boothiomyces sp. JEL0866]